MPPRFVFDGNSLFELVFIQLQNVDIQLWPFPVGAWGFIGKQGLPHPICLIIYLYTQLPVL